MSLHGALAEHDRQGKEVITGEIALDGSNPTSVTTALATIDGVYLTLKTDTALGVSTSVVTWEEGSSANVVDIYGWKPTSSADTTLIASDGTETVSYIIVGRRR